MILSNHSSRLSFLFSAWVTVVVVIPNWMPATSIAVVADDRCSSSSTPQQQCQCPNPDACPESGHSLVSECLDCDGYLSSDYEEKECFDRKLLSLHGNPSKSYFYRDWIGIIVWFVAAGVGTFVLLLY
jgi:hypothetical protein